MLNVVAAAGVRSTSDLRRRNRADIFRALLGSGEGATRQDLVERTGLGPATVSLLVSELIRAGVLRGSTSLPIRSGRPPALIAVNPDYGCLVGIDVAETYVSAQAFDLGLAAGASRRLPAARGGRDLVETCIAAVRGVVPDGLSLRGVGVSVPGLVDPMAGRVVRTPDGRIADLDLADALARPLGLSVIRLDNPLRASVMGELWAGLGRFDADLAVVTLGTGVGAGFAVEGRLRRGANNLAGEWGHVPVEPGGRRCRCGGRGCLEAYLGAPGIIATMRERRLFPAADIDTDLDEEGSIRALRRLLGDPTHSDHLAAVDAMSTTAARLGDGLTMLRHIVDPALIVVGGWVGDLLGPWLLPLAKSHADARLLHATSEATWLRLSELGARQVMSGGASLALVDVIDRAVL